MLYFEIIRSLADLVGESGILRLPSYIFDIFVFDNTRLDVLGKAQRDLINGERVIITGRAGSGKTSLMTIILRNMFESGFGIARLLDDATIVGNEHEEKGLVLFFDDIVRISKLAAKSIVKNKPRTLLATLREEDIRNFESKLGKKIESIFNVYSIGLMSNDKIIEILVKMADKENITVEDNVKEIIAEKASNLPIYIWQLIRDLKANRRSVLDIDFAESIPKGMLRYVDEILWKILDDHEDKFDTLLTLRILADVPNFELHQDLINTVFAIAKSKIHGGTPDLRSSIFSDVFNHMLRYLLKTTHFTFKLPHDSWADVLNGKSKGIISSDIIRINSLFTLESRREILEEAIRTCEEKIIKRIKDEKRREAFYNQLRYIGIALGEAKIDAYAILYKMLPQKLNSVKKILDNLSKRSLRKTFSPEDLGKYLIATTIYVMRTGQDEYLGRIEKIMSRLLRSISREDSYVINFLYNIATSKPDKATYNLGKLILKYGKKEITELLKIMLLNFDARYLSDIVLSLFPVSPEILEDIFFRNNSEFLYVLSKMDIEQFLGEVQDIMRMDKELGLRFLRTYIGEIEDRLKNIDTDKKVDIIEKIAMMYKPAREALTDVITSYCLLKPQEMRMIGDSNFKELLDYMKNLVKIDPKLTDFLRNDDYIEVLGDILPSDPKFLSELIKVVAKLPSATYILGKLSTYLRQIIGQLNLSKIISLISRIRNADVKKIDFVIKLAVDRSCQIIHHKKLLSIRSKFNKLLGYGTQVIIEFFGGVVDSLLHNYTVPLEFVEGLIVHLLTNSKSMKIKDYLNKKLALIIKHKIKNNNWDGAINTLTFILMYDLDLHPHQSADMLSALSNIEQLSQDMVLSLLVSCALRKEAIGFVFRCLKKPITRYLSGKNPSEIAHIIRFLYYLGGSDIFPLVQNIAKIIREIFDMNSIRRLVVYLSNLSTELAKVVEKAV